MQMVKILQGDGYVCFSLLLVKMFNAIALSED